MTPEQQRIAIAEACGRDLTSFRFKHQGVNRDVPQWSPSYNSSEEAQEVSNEEARRWGTRCWPVESFIDQYRAPDYLNDLNAMHEAEKVLDDGVLWKGYLNRLWDVVCPQFEQMSGLNAAIGLLLVHATAKQRAEAFLKTLNLWKP